ncbi:extracellular solute-binding protein [Martelella radicis]|uniref:Multiple sugar transport system substrate-binding protein n=1 Tax=Martelella radicis TaxID=1397476 RepID=A0A7W6KNE5_9HYPH|nr:extracellular solute-binding protein [Martelella radicis]MBB4123050.1 multiple sugar transport system substrate-binding protein [Martelella radicis]
MTTTLKGLTWSHPRGFAPMEAAARQWLDETGVCIEWDKGHLQGNLPELVNGPLAALTSDYDLLVIDHTHLGHLVRDRSLLPLQIEGRERERREIESGAIGKTWQAYQFRGQQWAFPIDASAEVMAYRPDRLAEPPAEWTALLTLAEEGRVLLPLSTPHALMVFFTLAAGLGTPCRAEDQGPLIGEDEGIAVYEHLAELASRVPEDNLTADPVAVLEALAADDTQAVLAPFISGFRNYATEGFRANRLAFTDVPELKKGGPASSALGGTGIAVSAASGHPDEALDFCHWLASGPVQSSLYAEAGGQPAHAAAWDSEKLNAAPDGFFRDTRAAVERAFLRPRHEGYVAFQQEASDVIIEALRTDAPAIAVIGRLNKLFENSFASGPAAVL